MDRAEPASPAPPRPAKPARVHGAPGVPGAPGRPPARAERVTLSRPRPPRERRLNAYVEAPGGRGPGAPPPPVTRQPAKRAACSRPPASIVCALCGRCLCAQCAEPRALPSRWLGESCLCSVETAIDYASCMCCVKALFYHCCHDGEGAREAYADSPCACSGGRLGARWSCLAALSAALPCLWCYWPLRGAAAACAGAYARSRPSGCRCPREPDKRPLSPPPPPPPLGADY